MQNRKDLIILSRGPNINKSNHEKNLTGSGPAVFSFSSFVIHQPKLMPFILSQSFRSSLYKSFCRQLKNYNFPGKTMLSQERWAAAPNQSWEVALFEVQQTKKLKVSIPTITAAANTGDDGGDGGGLELSSGASALSTAQTLPQEELLAQEDGATKPAISNNSASVDDDYSTYVHVISHRRSHPLWHRGVPQRRGGVLGIQYKYKLHSKFLWRMSSQKKERLAQWSCSNQN